jgi:hypothetical protein
MQNLRLRGKKVLRQSLMASLHTMGMLSLRERASSSSGEP